MGKVLIIKNNNSDERIHRYAMESYEQGKKCYYNSVDGTLNEQALMELKKKEFIYKKNSTDCTAMRRTHLMQS